MKGSAPRIGSPTAGFGTQVVPVRKPQNPKVSQAGPLSATRAQIMRPTAASTPRVATAITPR